MSRSAQTPLVLYCCKGVVHLIYAIWSIRSLQRFDYSAIEIIVSNQEEKYFFLKHCASITCRIIDADIGKYPKFSYKPFVLIQYFKKYANELQYDEIVICDADVLWLENPQSLFLRVKGKNWIHKITAVNPEDFSIPCKDIKKSNIGLRTIKHYDEIAGIKAYPNFILNAGLFMIRTNIMLEMLETWMKKIIALAPEKMLLSEALMSLTYVELGLLPVSDKQDIKHLGIEKKTCSKTIVSFLINSPCSSNELSGYQIAKHYYGDQREALYKKVKDIGVDTDNLSEIVFKEMKKNKVEYYKSKIKKLLKLILNPKSFDWVMILLSSIKEKKINLKN